MLPEPLLSLLLEAPPPPPEPPSPPVFPVPGVDGELFCPPKPPPADVIGVVIVKEAALAIASSCWDLRTVYRQIKADEWV